MAGEIEAAQQGLALAKETMPLVKDIIGMFKELMGGMGGITNVATPTPTPTPAPSTEDIAPVLKRIATSLEAIQAGLSKRLEALDKK
jgi:hypothetical protein